MRGSEVHYGWFFFRLSKRSIFRHFMGIMILQTIFLKKKIKASEAFRDVRDILVTGCQLTSQNVSRSFISPVYSLYRAPFVSFCASHTPKKQDCRNLARTSSKSGSKNGISFYMIRRVKIKSSSSSFFDVSFFLKDPRNFCSHLTPTTSQIRSILGICR